MIAPSANPRRRLTQPEPLAHRLASAAMEPARLARLIVSHALAVPPMIVLSVQMARCCSITLVCPRTEMEFVQSPI